MATKNLADMKDKLYEAFDNAFSAYTNVSNSLLDIEKKSTSRAQMLNAITEIVQATTVIEHELALLKLVDEARERGDAITLDVSSGGSSTMSTIRFKPKTGP